MKKLIVAVLALSASIASAQSTPKTPNLNFWLPQYGQLNWQEPYNANTTQLDLMLSGQAPVPGLNVSGQFKAINSITSTTPVIDARFWGAVGDGATDNTTAINNAIAVGVASNECVFFPPGVYAHASVIAVTPGASVQAVCLEGKNRNSRFKFTGSSGSTAGWTLVGGGSNNTKFVLRNLQWDANGNAQYALEISKSAKSEFLNLEARNSTIGGFWCRNCVSDNWMQPVVSGHLEPFTTTPVNGLTLDTDGTGSSGGETVTDMAFENVSGAGLNMASVVTSNIQGGTGELDGIGISCPAGCQSNHFEMQDLEANTSEDILLAGLNNTFTSELALDANSAQLNSLARGNSFLGGYYTQINVASGAYGNMFEGGRMVNAINDAGRYTTLRNMYDFPLAAFWPDVIPENATYSGAHTYNGQTTYGSLPIWSFPGWQGKFIALQQPENYLLQSGNAAISPWAYQQLGAGVAPTATASGATDPLGNTGTVTEVQLSLGGGTTTGDRSILEQTVSGLSNPHSSRQCIYIKANTGTPTVLVGNLATGNGMQIVTTAAWQGPICTTSVSSSSASDQWALEILGGSVYSSTADVLIYGAQESLNNGKYVATTTAPIDFTPYVPLGGASAGFTLGAQSITSTANATATNTVIPNCATGGSGTQVCDAAGNWITPATGGVSSFNGRTGAIAPVTGDYTAAQVTSAAATNAANAFSAAQTAPAFNLQSKSAGPYATFFDDFYTEANVAFAAIGSETGYGCATSNTYQDVNHPGNFLLTSGTGGAGTGVVCGVNTNDLQQVTTVSSSLPWTWETAVYVPVLPGTTAGSYQAGLTHTSAASPWATGMGFYLSSTNSTVNDWYCESGPTPTLTDSTVAATVGWTRLTMVNNGTNVLWYIGGTQVCSTAIANVSALTQYVGMWSVVTYAGIVNSGTYTSGITATGTTGQTCILGSFNNGSTATATVALTGANIIAANTALVITLGGTNAYPAPTAAVASNGTATCSGTATVSTTIATSTGVGMAVDYVDFQRAVAR